MGVLRHEAHHAAQAKARAEAVNEVGEVFGHFGRGRMGCGAAAAGRCGQGEIGAAKGVLPRVQPLDLDGREAQEVEAIAAVERVFVPRLACGFDALVKQPRDGGGLAQGAA